MRRTLYSVMALALVLGFTQCKKENLEPENEGKQVMITLNVGGGDNNGSKAVVTPPSVTFETGDKILVASDGHYVGTLTYNGTNFNGDITDPVVGKPLYFYFLGNNAVLGSANGNGDITNCTVNISDQTDYPHLPVISMGVSINRSTGATVTYPSANNEYEAQLHNKCALVKFSTNLNSSVVNVASMNTMASVNFGTGAITSGTSGTVSFNTDDSGIGWAILLEQSAVNGAAVTATGYQDGTCDVPAISNNAYITDGDAVSISLTATPVETLITWNSSTISDINIPGNGSSFTDGGITVTSRSTDAKWNNSGSISTITLKSTSDKLTFSTANGTITKIIITLNPTSGSVEGTPSSGWTYNGLPNYTLTWTDSSSLSVDLGCVSSKGFPGGGIGPGIETEKFKVAAITKVEFTVQQ